MEIEWKENQDRGTVYSYTVVHHATDESLKAEIPYVIALAEIEGLDVGSRFYGRLFEIEPSEIYVGLPVQVVIRSNRNGESLPVMVPREDA
jgi:uncharacterized OB-fold protein